MKPNGFFSDEMKEREIPIRDRTGSTLILHRHRGSITPKGKTKRDKKRFKYGKVVWGQQSGTEKDPKVILIEEILWENGRKELRFGYRTLTHKKGVWWWGQSALMAPIEDIQELLKLAKDNGLLSM
jgi:hypothetical protein